MPVISGSVLRKDGTDKAIWGDTNSFCFFQCFVVVYLFGGHTQQCSGHTPDSAPRNYSWQFWGKSYGMPGMKQHLQHTRQIPSLQYCHFCSTLVNIYIESLIIPLWRTITTNYKIALDSVSVLGIFLLENVPRMINLHCVSLSFIERHSPCLSLLLLMMMCLGVAPLAVALVPLVPKRLGAVAGLAAVIRWSCSALNVGK